MVYLVKEPKLSEGFVVQEYSEGAFRASRVDLAKRDLPHAKVALDMICHSLQLGSMQLIMDLDLTDLDLTRSMI